MEKRNEQEVETNTYAVEKTVQVTLCATYSNQKVLHSMTFPILRDSNSFCQFIFYYNYIIILNINILHDVL